jgi:hypothetical protein
MLNRDGLWRASRARGIDKIDQVFKLRVFSRIFFAFLLERFKVGIEQEKLCIMLRNRRYEVQLCQQHLRSRIT